MAIYSHWFNLTWILRRAELNTFRRSNAVTLARLGKFCLVAEPIGEYWSICFECTSPETTFANRTVLRLKLKLSCSNWPNVSTSSGLIKLDRDNLSTINALSSKQFALLSDIELFSLVDELTEKKSSVLILCQVTFFTEEVVDPTQLDSPIMLEEPEAKSSSVSAEGSNENPPATAEEQTPVDKSFKSGDNIIVGAEGGYWVARVRSSPRKNQRKIAVIWYALTGEAGVYELTQKRESVHLDCAFEHPIEMRPLEGEDSKEKFLAVIPADSRADVRARFGDAI